MFTKQGSNEVNWEAISACKHCGALRWKKFEDERKTFCCMNGEVGLGFVFSDLSFSFSNWIIVGL